MQSTTVVVLNWHFLGRFGAAFQPNGAVGVGIGMTLVGNTLHAFTFSSAAGGPFPNEYWAIGAVPIGSSGAASSPAGSSGIGLRYLSCGHARARVDRAQELPLHLGSDPHISST